MAPEQVRGEAADHRADIFAFGAVFYEMLVGPPAFGGDPTVERMTAILKDDPPALPAGAVPPHLDRVVHRCLEKSPSQRFQSASDIAFALEAMSALDVGLDAAAAGRRDAREAPVAAARAGRRRRWAASPSARWRCDRRAPAPVRRRELRGPDVRPAADHQRAVHARRPDHRLQRDAERIVAGALRHQPRRPKRRSRSGCRTRTCCRSRARASWPSSWRPRFLDQRLYSGTLARMTIGSSPRAVAEDVREADWSPDGSAMAIVHDLGNGRDRLEFPVGTALHEASGYLSNPRVSPDGSRVAFVEHQLRFDDRGWVKVVDRAGKVTTLTGELFGVQGLAWTPDGSTILFSGNTDGVVDAAADGRAGVGRRAGRGRSSACPARFIVFDVAARRAMAGGARGSVARACARACPARTPSATCRGSDRPARAALSADGGWLLMVDVGPRGGPNYGVVLRKTDASQAIRLGEGLRPEALARRQVGGGHHRTPAQLVLYPTGPGDAIRVGVAPIAQPHLGRVVPGREAAARLRLGAVACRRAATAWTARGRRRAPMTPEGVLATLAPDGRTLLLAMPDGGFAAVVDRRRPDAAGPRAAVRRPPDRVEPRQPGGLRAAGLPGARHRRARRARDRRALRRAPARAGGRRRRSRRST